jgi:mannan endo-1,4-beta-mannosidase
MGRVRAMARQRLVLALLLAGVVAAPQLLTPPRAWAATGSWTQLAATGPAARNRAVMVYDEAQGNVVLFGGQASSGVLNDTWTWNGTTWTQQQPASSPPARAAAGAAYDRVHGRVLVFGGVISANGKLTYFGDTWSWDGTTWTQLHPASSPSARQLADMAFDPTGQQVVLFGGHNGVPLGDTWTWNGTTWTQRLGAVTPTPRVESSMATDEATSNVVLFGGFGIDGTEDSDTWTWSNGAWTQLSPFPSPSARSGAAMAYDAAQSHLVLFGGGCCSYPATSTDADTWTFDGNHWTLASFNTPSARQYAAAATAGAQGSVLLFGGLTSSGNGQDTWQWNDNALPAHPTAGILFGEYPGIGCSTGPSTCGNDANGLNQPSYIAALDGWQGRHDALLNTYAGWGESDPTLFNDTLPRIWNEGSVPSISWNPTSMGTEVADGADDAYLIGFAQEMKRFLAGPDGVYGNGDDRRVYLRLAWEMNGDWFNWMPAWDGDDVNVQGKTPLNPQSCSSLASKEAAFVASWRHIHNVIVGQGLDSTRLAWDFSVNAGDADTNGCDDYSTTRGTGLMEHLFPGDAYVDWVGIDGYNWGGNASPSAVFGLTASRLRAISARPLGVDEVGTPPSTAYPKAQWISDYFSYLAANGFRKSTWFNIDKEEPWGVFQPPTYANGNGDTTVAYGGVSYHAWNAYQAGINGANMIGSDPANPRLLSDSDFLGL